MLFSFQIIQNCSIVCKDRPFSITEIKIVCSFIKAKSLVSILCLCSTDNKALKRCCQMIHYGSNIKGVVTKIESFLV
jgi:hypothetical protein